MIRWPRLQHNPHLELSTRIRLNQPSNASQKLEAGNSRVRRHVTPVCPSRSRLIRQLRRHRLLGAQCDFVLTNSMVQATQLFKHVHTTKHISRWGNIYSLCWALVARPLALFPLISAPVKPVTSHSTGGILCFPRTDSAAAACSEARSTPKLTPKIKAIRGNVWGQA
jgi:hypothetical protein